MSVVSQFHSSLTKLAGSTFSLMTFGPQPLRQYLHPEAQKQKLTIQRYLNHYLDLASEFTKAFPSEDAPASLEDLAESILTALHHPFTRILRWGHDLHVKHRKIL